MRVLMLAPTPFFSDRGCHVRIYEQARYLGDQGHQVIVLTYPIGYDPPGLTVRRVPAVSGYDREDPGPSWHRLYLDALVLQAAWRLCREERPDLIHAHLHEGCLAGLALRRRFQLPLIFDYQGSLSLESLQHGFIREGSLMHRAFAAVEDWIDRGADRIIVSARTMADSLVARGLKAEAVPDGVDPERFSPGPPDPELKRRLGLPPDKPIAVYLGVLSEYQGADIILKAAAYLRARGEAIHFLVMGYPEGLSREESRRLGLTDVVTFTGRVNYFQAADYLRLGNVALAPKLSRTEGNGKVLNYMACGLPVAAFDLPINREISGGHAGLAAVGEDREESARNFGDAVLRLLQDPEGAGEMARAARTRAVSELSQRRQGERLLAVYQSALGGKA